LFRPYAFFRSAAMPLGSSGRKPRTRHRIVAPEGLPMRLPVFADRQGDDGYGEAGKITAAGDGGPQGQGG
jgi:hypothetical protein